MSLRIERGFALAAIGAVVACSHGTPSTTVSTTVTTAGSVAGSATSLKDAYAGLFLVGAAVNAQQMAGDDAKGAALVKAQFNTISPENVLKWEHVHPRPGEYDFSKSDQFVDFGTKNGMFVVGHTLVWHSQTPRWVFQDSTGKPLTRDALLARMEDHIKTVVGHYKGRVNGWDVVNEALNEDGTLRASPWKTIIGEDYIVKAFQFAHAADPKAELYYNDYNLENAPKRNGVIQLVKNLRAAGVTITGVGSQSHDKLWLSNVAKHDTTIAALGALGVKVHITELDVDVLPAATQNRTADVSVRAQGQTSGSNALNPYSAGLPDSVQQALAKRYADFFAVFVKHADVVDRVTLWGVGDGDSWLNDWPMPGRTNYPLLFDRKDLPKPAFDAVLNVGRQARAGGK